ncbi:hypothetical protein [Rhodococcus sp. JVH1]|uniref:hypothetical protein n=1 Tax=Rhodococcus sp. JVH1 TaxID=745408 RepID=UPI00027207D4|nr:hypothetical protein [Rhodococcus sp. JVH1]EJJ00993.1 hypothetical protein JVH1_1619 [Rhodococcus sp. JVH1]
MPIYNPWRQLRNMFPHVTVTTHQALPALLQGALSRDWIYIDRNLGQAGRRCTLAHELVHRERGTVCAPDRYTREEQAVDEIAARRLITTDRLVDALLWTGSRAGVEAADEVWCNAHMLGVRVRTLTADERALVAKELQRRQPW